MLHKGMLWIIWAMLFMAGSSRLNAQEVWFFSEGTDENFYDQGIVDVANLGESLFEYTHPPGGPQWNDKVPCSTNAYSGSTSLKFNYTSSASGNWKVKIYRNDWSSADISGLDTLAFFIYSETGMPGSALPLIGLQAENTGGGETETGLYFLSLFNEDIPASTWVKMAIPLEVILEDGDNALLDFSKTKAVILNQSESDNSSRVFLADNVVAYKSLTDIPAPEDFAVTGYDSHAELTWEQPVPDLSYSISASFDGGANFQERILTTGGSYMDFLSQEQRNMDVIYRIVTKSQDRESEALEQTAQIRDFTDDELMDMVQRYTFRYFWEGAHQATGMALERSNGNGRTAASGATGMGLMAMIVAHEREYKPKEEVKDRILLILDFLETCDRHHGAWSHWYNADTKETQPFSPDDDGGDMVETSFVAEALIALKNYFIMEDAKSGQIRDKADELWKEIDWDWYRQDGQNVIYWHWSPNVGWAKNHQVRGWNEALVTYIMAASSPTHGIPKEVYTNGWTRNGDIVNKRRFYERNIYLSPNWGGPMFWLHYTHLGIDARGLMDESVNYWDEYVNTSMIHYEYAKDNPKDFENYSEHCWGLTASDDPDGYTAHRPWENDNGTISPTAALASMPYTPAESMKALKYFYRERGAELFGPYGPYDAFNDSRDWVQEAYIGIDQGPIVVMIENHRTGLLWNAVKKDTDVKAGLQKLGFWYDPVDVKNETVPEAFSIYPNPGNGTVTIHCPGLTGGQPALASLYTMDGRLIKTELLHQDESQVNWSDVSKGLYLVRVQQGDSFWNSKLFIQ